jgi:hypothetical protein
VTPILKTIVYAALFIAYLIVEVVLAMLVYMYLNLYHLDTFGRLVGWSRELLSSFATYLETLSPQLANQANATILGELGAKSILLLFIGLIVSAFVRMLGWCLHNLSIWFFNKSVEVVPQ